jgi:hypothetical protein
MEPEAGARRKRMTRGVEKGFAHPKQTLGANTGDIQYTVRAPAYGEGAALQMLRATACRGYGRAGGDRWGGKSSSRIKSQPLSSGSKGTVGGLTGRTRVVTSEARTRHHHLTERITERLHLAVGGDLLGGGDARGQARRYLGGGERAGPLRHPELRFRHVGGTVQIILGCALWEAHAGTWGVGIRVLTHHSAAERSVCAGGQDGGGGAEGSWCWMPPRSPHQLTAGPPRCAPYRPPPPPRTPGDPLRPKVVRWALGP